MARAPRLTLLLVVAPMVVAYDQHIPFLFPLGLMAGLSETFP